MDSLIHCIYTSTGAVPFDDASLLRLLDQARSGNSAAGVTGMMLYSRAAFFQVLEGRPAAVDSIFDCVYGDPRHRDILQIIHEPIAQRSFPDWTMGYADLSERELGSIAGLDDFPGTGSCLAAMDDARARKVLAAFASGRWRMRVSNEQDVSASHG